MEGLTYGNSPLEFTGHRQFGAAARKAGKAEKSGKGGKESSGYICKQRQKDRSSGRPFTVAVTEEFAVADAVEEQDAVA